MHNFKDQTAIVTGGTRGIGKGIAKAFLEQGATVVATYASNDEAANQFKEELGELGQNLILKKFDVSSHSACEAFFEEITKELDKIDILVNNSGRRSDNITAAMSEQQWDSILDINLKGTFNMSKFATLHMMRNRYGRIINISSIGGSLGLQGQANYAASKAGQVALSKSLSKEVAKRNITVNNVAPGFIETELISDLPEDQVKEYKKQVPMKRFGKVEEVANTVLFLASDKASYITGTTIEVSGGL
ncbi:MAG: 3-oxoacyl-[acyl-carrier-protein] reductase [Bacteriovoracaceae bacterium]|nr:3-oxoacyl-[acyl-carrier-protein] reductase [Bacteriovoracaceae bacterium]